MEIQLYPVDTVPNLQGTVKHAKVAVFKKLLASLEEVVSGSDIGQ